MVLPLHLLREGVNFGGNGLSNLPQSNIHTHHHTLDIPYDHNYKGIKNTKYKWFEKLNFNFLSMMNVKYVLSHNLLPISNSYNLITSSDKISKLPALHVYNLNDTWDRIYIPNELILSRFDSSTRDFYDDLKNNFNKNFVYIGYNDFSSSSSEFKNLILNSESLNTNLQYEVIIDSSDNYTIKTSGCGFLVFNYCADKIYFSFENKIIESIPVNGLHTLIYLNDFVDTLQVDFR